MRHTIKLSSLVLYSEGSRMKSVQVVLSQLSMKLLDLVCFGGIVICELFHLYVVVMPYAYGMSCISRGLRVGQSEVYMLKSAMKGQLLI